MRKQAVVLAGAFLVLSCSGGSTPAPGTLAPSPAVTSTSSPTSPPVPFDPGAVNLALRPLVSGLDSPLLVTNAGDGSERLFVVERAGRILVIDPGSTRPATFLDISDRIVSGGEQGLLGLAFHPDYASNGRSFVDYTDTNGDTVVAEYHVSATDPDRADPASARLVLGFDQPFSNHNGGGLAFGPDGFLYVASGDGGSEGDPDGNGQRLDTLLAKMLRIDVDTRTGGGAYGIPADNPFVGDDEARPEIWAYGLRNPWRFSFDRATGDLWIGDVGQNTFEEIDHVASTNAGVNYGWKRTEGFACYDPAVGCDRTGLTDPVAVYDHSLGCAVIGGFVYRGTRWPALTGAYLYSDNCSGTIWGLDAASTNPKPAVLLETHRSISSFGEDEAGELYLTDLGGGELLEVVAPAA